MRKYDEETEVLKPKKRVKHALGIPGKGMKTLNNSVLEDDEYLEEYQIDKKLIRHYTK